MYIKNTKELKLDPDIELIKIRLLRVSSTIVISETYLAPPDEPADAISKELSAGCGACENVPIVVRQNLADLFKEIRSPKLNVEHTCGGIDFAFALSGRTYVLSHASTCESDSYYATLVHDLSGERPRLVFSLSGGL